MAAATLVMLSWPATGMGKTAFQAAQAYMEAGQITEARRALQAELRLRPGNIEARFDLAVLLQKIGHAHDAMELYRQNLRREWHLPSLTNLAMLLQQQGKEAKARAWLLQGTNKIRHEAAPWYLLATIAEQHGDISNATRLYRRATQADPLSGFAWLRFASFQSRHKLADRGIHHAAKAMRLLTDCAACWRSYGDILQRSGDIQGALRAYQRSLAIQPGSATRQQLIHVLRKLGDTDRAERMQQALHAWHKHHSEK